MSAKVRLAALLLALACLAGCAGEVVYANGFAEVDVSDADEGSVEVRVVEPTGMRVKVQVQRGDSTVYTYDLNGAGEGEILPLSDGAGVYAVRVYEQVEGTSYREMLAAEFEVEFEDESAPFLARNKYVNWSGSGEAARLSHEVCEGAADDAERVRRVFEYVCENVRYDREFAAEMPAGYVPSPDETARLGVGVCLDYASLMAAMLREQGIAVKLVVGDAGEVYHAWCEVLLAGEWVRRDPTFSANADGDAEVLGFVADGENYSPKYYY